MRNACAKTIETRQVPAVALRTVLGGWRRRNLTLLRLSLFASDPRDLSARCNALAHEAVRSGVVAAELAAEAEGLSRRNCRLSEAMKSLHS